MARPRNRFVPRLEAFDDRCLPSVSAFMVGTGILQIVGDAAANTVEIRDSGAAGGITVIGDGVTSQFSVPISAIIVDTGDGNDIVSYNLLGPLSGLRSIVVELGRGNDSFTGNLTGQTLTQGANLDLSVYGRGGKDTLVLNARDVSTEQGSILNVYYAGGAGKDTVTFDYSAGPVALGTVILDKDQR